MSKAGMNIITLKGDYPAEWMTWCTDGGGGVWDAGLDIPRTAVCGKLADAGISSLRYPGGQRNRYLTVGETMKGAFGLEQFALVCKAIGATPILTTSFVQGAGETIEVLDTFRQFYGDDEVIIELGNHPWTGKFRIDKKWTFDTTPQESIDYINEAIPLIQGNCTICLMVTAEAKQMGDEFMAQVRPHIDMDAIDLVSLFSYKPGDKVADVEGDFEAVYDSWQKPLMVSEWNMRNSTGGDAPVGHGTQEHFLYCHKFLKLMDTLDYVHSHQHFCLEGYYGLFDKSNHTPRRHWQAFVNHAEE